MIDPVCGDGELDGHEGCDDGNTTSGDGCTAKRTLEVVGDCSPGYFKYHTPVWDALDDGLEIEAQCCTGAIDASDGVNTGCEQVLVDLIAKGGNGRRANARAAELNQCMAPAVSSDDSPISADPSVWKSFSRFK